MSDKPDPLRLFAFHPEEDEKLTRVGLSTNELVERAVGQRPRVRPPRSQVRTFISIAAALVIVAPVAWLIVQSSARTPTPSMAITVQCFRGASEGAQSEVRALRESLEATCYNSVPGDHGQSFGSFACVRLTGQVAVFHRRQLPNSASCATLGLPPFVGNIQKPDQVRLLHDVRQINVATSCLSPSEARLVLAAAIGRTGAGGWTVRGGRASPCVRILAQLHHRTFVLIKAVSR